MSNETIYPGIVISSHDVRDASSKLAATLSLVDWQFVEQTATQWISDLEQGNTIQPSQFSPTPKTDEDGNVIEPVEYIYTHAKEHWQGTHFVCADADHIRGVEFNKDTGADVNPDGVDAWQADKQLCVLYPPLADDCYAALQSVSSISDDKPPPHRRYRLLFVFDEKIESVDHYSQILRTLSQRYPIIPSADRSPAQPVFGNSKETGKSAVTGNVLSLSDYPYVLPVASDTASSNGNTPKSKYNATQRRYCNNLDGLITDAKLTRHETASDGKIRVDCPFNSEHKRDAFVGVDADGYPCFSCHHNSCSGNGFNAMVKQAGIEVAGRPTIAERATEIEAPETVDDSPEVMLSEWTIHQW